ncbi:MAG TPA: hypothetical protein VG734_16445 [Lacunisphaera sp.]|nr:hypothetical protein [Lacunisphaera sp.]
MRPDSNLADTREMLERFQAAGMRQTCGVVGLAEVGLILQRRLRRFEFEPHDAIVP